MWSALRIAICLAGLVGALAQPLNAQQARPPAPPVTPVTGPGWLTKLGVTLSETSIGRASRHYGPTTPPAAPAPSALVVPESVSMAGADLYRLNCQACHGLTGAGAPPEVKSAVDPIRGVSLDVLRQQMKAQHQPDDAEARAAPGRVRARILLRMHQGGQRMPSRDHLTDAELDLVFGYLTALAGTSASARPREERVGWDQLGQHVVKGTCHICHDAVGPRPTDKAMIAGAIPSLASLVSTSTVADFVSKARTGKPVTLPTLGLSHRGRMPVFDYLQDREIAAAYMYLATHPPQR
jgi:mono/diheme cytochrome c family protein